MKITPKRNGVGRRGRAERRQVGCLSLVIVLGVLLGVFATTWDWLGDLFNNDVTRQTESTLRAAQRAFDSGDLDTAIELARQTWNGDQEDSQALVLLVRALIYRSYSDYDRELDRALALQTTTQVVQANPRNADILAIHALALQVNQNSFQAAQFANRALALDPQHPLANIALALAYGGVGGYENALKQSRLALELSAGGPYEMDAQRGLAISLGDLGRYREAIQTVNDAIETNNRLPLLHFERALYAILDGDPDGATSAYFQVLAFAPGNVKARLRMCELSSLLRESETAVQYCTDVTEKAPGWVDGWYHLGREYYLEGNFTKAAQTLKRCTTLSNVQDIPTTDRRLDCWYLQGQALEILRDCDGLLQVYNEFLEMAASADLPQTWTYPPEGPAICNTP